MVELLTRLARKHVFVKFIKCVATSCVENFHDLHVPAMFLYLNGELVVQDVPCAALFGGMHMNEKTIEYVLTERKVIEVEFNEDPRDLLKMMNIVTKRGKDAGRNHEDDVDDDGDDREYMDNQFQRYR